jgi:hypothetical protein
MRYLLAFCLFAAGYLIGTIEPSTHAQSSGYYYGDGGTYGNIYTPTPGGPSYYYGMDGSMGTVVPSNPPMDLYAPKSPC